MYDFVIVGDGTCDLNEELRKKYDIEYITGHMHYPDGQDRIGTLNWSDYTYFPEQTSECFYNELKKNPDGYKTSPANVQEYYNFYEKFVKEGKAVLSISLSSGISGAYNFSLQAKQAILEKYPEAKIRCIDSLRFGPGDGLLIIYAAIQRAAGKSFDEVSEYIENNKCRFHQMGWLDDLSFVAKKGRISATKAFFGTLIGVKALGEFDYNGLTTPIGKAKGEKSAYRAIMEYIENTIENPSEQIIFIAQTNRLKQAEELKRLIEEKFSPKEVVISAVYPLCGVNIGPGLMAAYYVGKEISKDLSEEKALMEKIINKQD